MEAIRAKPQLLRLVGTPPKAISDCQIRVAAAVMIRDLSIAIARHRLGKCRRTLKRTPLVVGERREPCEKELEALRRELVEPWLLMRRVTRANGWGVRGSAGLSGRRSFFLVNLRRLLALRSDSRIRSRDVGNSGRRSPRRNACVGSGGVWGWVDLALRAVR